MDNVLDLNDYVAFSGDKLVTDSRKVAERFNKQHAKVTRTIAALRKQTGEWGIANFGDTPYTDPQNGQIYQAYNMTKDGFMLLVMSFTGKQALAVKLKFITAFNDMANYITQHQQSLWQQMQALIAQDSQSKVRASFGARLMLERKRALPVINAAHAELVREIQMPLFVQ